MEDRQSLDTFETFLDRIEDPNLDVLRVFQNQFEASSPFDNLYLRSINQHCIEIRSLPEEKPITNPHSVHDGEQLCSFQGAVNANGFPTGDGLLIYKNKNVFSGVFQNGVYNRHGILTNAEEGGSKLQASWKDGFMEGYFRKDTNKEGWEEGFCRNGIRHGFYRRFGPSCWNYDALQLFGRFSLGRLEGVCWKGLLGGGYLVGKVDPQGAFTGDNFVYLYPDFRNAIAGRFLEGILVEGRHCIVIGSISVDGIIMPCCSEPMGSTFSFDPSTATRISRTPMVRDPWEDALVEVRASSVAGGGEGLFAKDDLEEGILICLFQGVRLRINVPHEERRPPSDYRIRMTSDYDLDIPNDMTSCKNYCATLGHKANHSFTPNAAWSLFEHPRFGLIRALASLRNIDRGEEILVNYNMPLDKAPDWYKSLWVRHVSLKKRWSPEDVVRYVERHYELTSKKIELPKSDKIVIPEPVGATLLDVEPDAE